MGKATRTGEQLRAMVQVRVNALAEVQRLIAAGARELPVVGLPDPQLPDPMGRNWDITQLQNGTGLSTAFRLIVEPLREKCDLASP